MMAVLDAGAVFSIVWLAVFLPPLVVGTVWFWLRKDLQPIKARSPKQLVFGNVVFIVFMVVLCMQRVFWKTYPCVLNLWQGYLGLIAIGNIYAVRAWMLYCAYTVTQLQIHQDDSSANDAVQRLRRYLSSEFIIKRVLLASLPLLIAPAAATVTVPHLVNGVGNCDRGFADYVLAAFFGAYLALFLWIAYKLQDVFDGFGIKAELKTVGWTGLVSLPTWMFFNTVHVLKDFNQNVFPISTFGILIAIIIAFVRGTVWPLHRSYVLNATKRAGSERDLPTDRDSRSPDALAGKTVSTLTCLRDVLSSDIGIDAFRTFCASEFAAENILFYEAVDMYRASSSKTAYATMAEVELGLHLGEIRNRARLLYQKYLAPDAPLEINLSFEVLQRTLRMLVAMRVISADEARAQRASPSGLSMSDTSHLIDQRSSVFTLSPSLATSVGLRPTPVVENGTAPTTAESVRAEIDNLLRVFNLAQSAIFSLMETDTYARFTFSVQYRQLMAKLHVRNEQNQLLKEINVL
ncbi:unnamed protein product (mitochondrion) [Plasmodiophora brassicae]|uniref:RGS domain-containing protein n=1 Tax=Plasmodiophora brassicae TaxID=37360 RepID=A0A3P3Y938_PLABS|nr:unnamed protein product [Plasmodiophora brassicae]